MGLFKFFLIITAVSQLANMVTLTPASALSLEEAVALALRNNPDLQKQQLNVHLAEKDVTDQKSQNFGRLDFVSTYAHYNLPRTLVPMTPATMAGDPASVATTRDLFTSGIVYEVPIFTGFARTRAVEIASLQKEMAAAGLKLSREQLIYNVRSIYISILSLRAQAKAQAAYVDSLQRLYDDISRELKLGKKARIDQLKAAADLKNGHAVQTQLENNILILKSSLASLLNSGQVGELQDIAISTAAMAAARDTFDNCLQDLQRIRNARLAVEKNEKLAEKAGSSFYPQIALNSSYGQNYGPNDSSNMYSGYWKSEEVWQAGLNLRWNIFDFGSNRAKVQKARIAARQSEYEKTKTELELKKSLHEAVSKINTALSDYTSARAEVAMTRETQSIEQVRFDQGASDINDLLYAKARNLMAESRLIDAGYRYRTARYYLDYLLEKGENR